MNLSQVICLEVAHTSVLFTPLLKVVFACFVVCLSAQDFAAVSSVEDVQASVEKYADVGGKCRPHTYFRLFSFFVHWFFVLSNISIIAHFVYNEYMRPPVNFRAFIFISISLLCTLYLP